MSVPKQLRCAIYTRKSTEEGLEQEFNTLDAQFEACRAYIISQKHEGWTLLNKRYDDGGFSGGNMERPALKHLMEDVKARRVDVIVVYKVDRLTRSLMDFSKIVDVLDEHGVSFVSITQQFNTTNSMGRLTLNVLLSFAQFEREVISERVRDKIAASSKRGIWMGGNIPLGYDVQDRRLIINDAEAKQVHYIFECYLRHQCVRHMKEELDAKGIFSKQRISKRSQQQVGGTPMSRGTLYKLLQNPIYIGKIRHKKDVYDGAHDAIISQDLWDEVQQTIKGNRVSNKLKKKAKNPSLLTGLIFDEQGNYMSPTSSHKNKRYYRYYTSQAVIRVDDLAAPTVARVPAHEIETIVLRRITSLLRSKPLILKQFTEGGLAQDHGLALLKHAKVLADKISNASIPDQKVILQRFLTKIQVYADEVILILSHQSLIQTIANDPTIELKNTTDDKIELRSKARFKRCGMESKIIIPSEDGPPKIGKQDMTLIKAITRAHMWKDDLLNKHMTIRDIAKRAQVTDRYVSKILELSFLSPRLTEAILNGNQPETLTLESLAHNVPLVWEGPKIYA